MNSSNSGLSRGVKPSGTTQQLKRKVSVQLGKLDRFILLQVACCTFPALILIRFGQLRAGSIWCFMLLFAFLALYGLKRNIPAFVALTVATLPALSYTREFFFYNSVLFVLGLGLIFWVARSPKEFSRLWDNHLLRWFFIVGTGYWLISVFLTGQYYSNFRVMELLCSVGSVYLLALYPKYLATGLMGLSISISAVAIGMVGQGERLGMADIEGEQMGNAITFALPVALVLLLAVADNAKWLYLQNSKIVKNVLIAMCGVLLLLSTSRGAGLVAFIGIVVAVFYQSQQRRKIFVAIFLMVCVLAVILQTKSGEQSLEWFGKLTDSERTLNNKTSGRFDMWMLFPKVLADSPIWGVGPGHGKEAYAYYSWVDREVMFKKGHEMAWHAVYMHVGVETGMIGLTLLAIFMGKLIFKTLHYRRVTGQVIPLIGIVGYMAIGLTVTAVDGISGLFLGLAFLGTMPSKKKQQNVQEFHQPEQVAQRGMP